MKISHFLLLSFLVMGGNGWLVAQTQAVPADSSLFDFWIGEWELNWEGGKGINRVERVLGEKVIQENFEGTEGKYLGFKGKSWSVYHPGSGKWKQTWVDNQGAYLDFEHKVEGKKRIFHRAFLSPKGQPLQQRMVFYNIQADSFDWDWELSTDEGKSWQLRWRIHYQRKQ